MANRRRPASPSTHRYPRTARLNESLREVIADELTRIDDERLDANVRPHVVARLELGRFVHFGFEVRFPVLVECRRQGVAHRKHLRRC